MLQQSFSFNHTTQPIATELKYTQNTEEDINDDDEIQLLMNLFWRLIRIKSTSCKFFILFI